MNTEMTFTATPSVYRLADGVDKMDVYDHLTARLDQLCAMLSMITGDGFENYQNANDYIQHLFLWNCGMAADECRELLALFGEMKHNERLPSGQVG